jgi:hypothetical protein
VFAGFSLKYHAPDIQIINHQGNTSTDRHKFILMEMIMNVQNNGGNAIHCKGEWEV